MKYITEYTNKAKLLGFSKFVFQIINNDDFSMNEELPKASYKVNLQSTVVAEKKITSIFSFSHNVLECSILFQFCVYKSEIAIKLYKRYARYIRMDVNYLITEKDNDIFQIPNELSNS